MNLNLSTPSDVIVAEALKRFSKRELAKHLGKDPRIITAFQRDGVDETYKMALLYLLQSNTPRPNQGKKHDFTFIDLFAGIGGTRMGFERAGGKCVFTSEWDTSAQKTYRANFSVDEHPIIGDIHEITVEGKWDLLPEHDVLVAGFPCQPFSIAGVSKKNSLGRAHGFACDAQGTLFFDIATIIERRRPKAFLLENVKNLMSHDKGNTFRVIKNVLEDELGYKIYPKIIDAKGFVPQHRERIYIVGFREEVGFNWDSFSQPPTDTKCMADILHPNDGSEEVEEPYTVGIEAKVNDKYTLSDKLWNYLQNYANKHRAAGNGFGFGLVNKDSIARTLSARYYKDGSEILVDQGKDKNPRRLTPRECARLMGFDSSEHKFNIVVADTPAYKQFGNSVVVPVITEIAHTMKPSIIQLKERYIRQISLAI